MTTARVVTSNFWGTEAPLDRRLELATRQIEKQISYLGQIKTWADTVQNNGRNIADRAEKMAADLKKEVERLDEQVRAMRELEEQAGAGRPGR